MAGTQRAVWKAEESSTLVCLAGHSDAFRAGHGTLL